MSATEKELVKLDICKSHVQMIKGPVFWLTVYYKLVLIGEVQQVQNESVHKFKHSAKSPIWKVHTVITRNELAKYLY